MPQQAHKIGVGAVVMNDKAGIDWKGAATGFNSVSVGVTAQPRVSFKQTDFMLLIFIVSFVVLSCD